MFKVPGSCYTSKIHLYNRPTADFVPATTTRAAPVLCKFPSLVFSWTSLRHSCVFIISAHRKSGGGPLGDRTCALMHGTSSAGPASSAYAPEIALAPGGCSYRWRLLFVTSRMLCDLGTWETGASVDIDAGSSEEQTKNVGDRVRQPNHSIPQRYTEQWRYLVGN